MRISPIHVAQPSINVSNNLRARKAQTQTNLLQTQSEPSFRGWKAGACSTIGAIVGGGAAAVLTGGTALLPILLGTSAGTLGGAWYGCSKEDDNHGDDYVDYEPSYTNHRDY